MSTFALTRGVSAVMSRCELVHLKRVPLNLELLRKQHGEYEQLLIELGCHLIKLPAQDELPDSVFVEDTAIIFDDFAVVTRPGAESRRPETSAIAAELGGYLELETIVAPGTLDGGDVLRVGKMVFVGASSRSNSSGIDQLEKIVINRGHILRRIDIEHCLHLKSAVTWIGAKRLLVNPAWVDVSLLCGYDLIEIDASEPAAANALVVGDTVIHGRAYQRTRARMQETGIRVAPVEISEIAKAEGAVTCCSLLFDA